MKPGKFHIIIGEADIPAEEISNAKSGNKVSFETIQTIREELVKHVLELAADEIPSMNSNISIIQREVKSDRGFYKWEVKAIITDLERR